MRIWRPVATGLLTVLSILFASEAFAQSGKIAGRVIDAGTGDPLPGVNVIINGTAQGTTTDVEGYYFILNVKPGTYAVRASFIGYAPMVVEDLRVMIDKTTTADFSLGEETLEGEEVVVTATRPLIQKDLTSTATSVSSDRIDALPVLTVSDVVNLQAGVVDGHFRGGRIGEVAYLVDGVPINDAYDRSPSYEVENNAIQEVEIITGTFNAEYGQAQSGIVNIVTKDGGTDYRATFSGFLGDYVTSDDQLFEETGSISPLGTYEGQATLGGPIISDKLTFFASGRYWYNDGYLYGRRVVQPVTAEAGTGEIVLVDGRQVFVPAFGDSTVAAMDWGERLSGNLKLTARPLSGTKISVSGMLQTDEGKDYDHLFVLNPDGIPTTYRNTGSFTAGLSQVLNSRSFLNVNASYLSNHVESYVYEDPLDPRWPRDDAIRTLAGNFSFIRGGTRMDYTVRETNTFTAGFDVTSQVNRLHQMKAGFEYVGYELDVDQFAVKNNPSTGFQPEIPLVGTPDHVRYNQKPIALAGFIQDKMEFDFMIVNLGLRFDLFDAQGEVLEDFGRPQTSPTVPTSTKWQLSPRFGLAYPLSENGVVHISYGHFFQMPAFEYLYTNPDYVYNPEEGVGRAFGYPDLEPQQTVQYEMGFQQAFSQVLGGTLSLYFKDIRNLLGTKLEVISPGFDEPFQLEKYGRFINRDYGQVKGFTASLEKRMSDGWALDVDYTFQIAEGNASDPRSTLIDEQSGNEPEKQLVPLDWDRRHQLNTSLSVGAPGNWLGTLIGRLGSGLPYTPSRADERIGIENSARRQGFVTFDLYLTKSLPLGGVPLSIFTRIFNLFDNRTEVAVYTDTGRAFANLVFHPGEPQGLNNKEEWFERPDFYGAPRQITVGLSLDL